MKRIITLILSASLFLLTCISMTSCRISDILERIGIVKEETPIVFSGIVFGEVGGAYTEAEIKEQIQKACDEGVRALKITGEYTISETILIPSDFTLILSDCALTLADGVMVQMIRNAGYKIGEENTLADGDQNISIIGEGRAILDGGNYNGLSEKTSNKNGNPSVSNNHTILFSNVHGFVIKGLQIRNQRYWAMNFLYSSDGYISDIDFCADDTYVDGQGNRIHGLLRNNYDAVYVKNADGIDLRAGCHDIVIENLTGFCEDDMVALTSLSYGCERTYNVTDAPKDIHDVVIRNIRAEGYCSLVRVLNQAPGTKLYNVEIDGVYDASAGSTHMDYGLYTVRVGDTNAYGRGTMADDSVHDVTIKNVTSRATYAVCLAGKMQNVTTDYETIHTFDSCKGKIRDMR